MESKRSEQPLLRLAVGTAWRNLWVPAVLALLVIVSPWMENGDNVNPYYLHVFLMCGISITAAVSLQLINGVSGQFSLGHAGFMAVGAYLSAYAIKTYGSGPGIEDPGFTQPAGVFTYFVALGVSLVAAGVPLLILFFLLRQLRRMHGALPAIAMLLVLAWFALDVVLANHAEGQTPWYCVWTRGFHLCTGLYNHLLTMSPRVTRWMEHVPAGWRQPLTFALALIGGGAAAAGAGFIVGLPTLRLRGDYLAIATLGFGEIVRVLIVNCDALGGATGLSAIPSFHLENDDDVPIRFIFPWVFGTVVLCFLFIWRLKYSSRGRAMRAVREDEIAASAVGINTTSSKVLAFMVGAFFAGVAGGLLATVNGYLNSDMFGFMRSVELVVFVTLGGLGNLWGAAIAATVLTLLPEILDNPDKWALSFCQLVKKISGWDWSAGVSRFTSHTHAFTHAVSINRLVIYAGLLVVVMIVRARWRDWIHGRWRWTG